MNRAGQALARLDEGQRAALALHDIGGVPVEDLAALFDVPADLAFAQLVRSRAEFRSAAGLEDTGELHAALNAVSFAAPRRALWPLIEDALRAEFERQARRQRLLTAGAVVGVVALVLAGALLVLVQDRGPAAAPTATSAGRVAAEPQGTVFSLAPTATPTPAANVSGAIVVYSGEPGGRRTSLFREEAAAAPLLGESAVEAGAPLVAPDGAQVFLLWYDYRGGSVSGYLTAWEGDLSAQLWQTTVGEDEQARPGEAPDFRLSAAVDHRYVYVARHPWTSSENIAIDVFERASGALLETIPTNLAGFAANDVRLKAPPGLGRVHLFAITGDAPAESGALSITFLAYQTPGGEKIHGRILHDQPDSRTFFLYESRLIAGGDTLFGVDYTFHYQQLAVHFFDLSSGLVLPRLVLPFQPVADPLPFQQAVSNNGHWLYVLSPASLEVAVVNLFDRSLAGIVPLDPGVLLDSAIAPRSVQGRDMQLAPDGSRLFAVGSGPAGPSGVWVIDAGSWTVVEHWLPETQPAEILLSGDGATLYLRSARPSASGVALLAIDTGSGEAHAIEMAGAGRYSLASIAALFRQTYALSPAVEGRQPAGSPLANPLATARVELHPAAALATEAVSVDVRFVHPLTGEPVTEDGGGARYQEPAGVRVSWAGMGGDAAPLILELGRVGYGHYQGFVRLPEPGEWSATIVLDWPDGGTPDRTLRAGHVQVSPEVSVAGAPQAAAPGG